MISLSIFLVSISTFLDSPSVWSMLRFSIVNLSLAFCFRSRNASICFSKKLTSFSVLPRAEVKTSFRSCSFLMLCLYPWISLSKASSASFCCSNASSVARNASSRRCIPIKLVFHCCSSCFFSKLMASISARASDSVSWAIDVSFFCESSWDSYRASLSLSCLICSFSESIRWSWCCFCFSRLEISSSALYAARRSMAISDCICSLNCSTRSSVSANLSSSDWYLKYFLRTSSTWALSSSNCCTTKSRSFSFCSRSFITAV
mmetsp:Transcript_125350/g.217323  ORF Transcript_125350/g.217323 Transcript_125350/m.217323 type:complete len:261 (+) Transcript_125350:2129-2911(+)